MPSLFFTCPKTRQQADTGILTDAESLRDTWSMTLNVNCPHCGQMHAVSVRETYIDDAIRNVSEIARRVMQNGESSLVSVREHIESSESFVIQEWWPDSRRVTDVDGEEPRSVRPQRIAISERSDRR